MTLLAVFYTAMSMLDLLLTIGALRMGGFSEGNQIMAMVAGNEPVFTGVKSAGTLFVSYSILHIRNKLRVKGRLERYMVYLIVGALVAIQTFVVIYNAWYIGSKS